MALAYTRALLKISGEALGGEKGSGLDFHVVEAFAEEIKAVHALGVHLALVVGGGNIIRGTTASREGLDRVSADYMGMLATVINALALQDVLEKIGVDTRVMTAIRMESVAEPYIRQLTYQEAIVKNYAVMDANAFGLCKANQLPIVVFNINQPGAISRVLQGDRVGTLVR
jgi:uridylate kinase